MPNPEMSGSATVHTCLVLCPLLCKKTFSLGSSFLNFIILDHQLIQQKFKIINPNKVFNMVSPCGQGPEPFRLVILPTPGGGPYPQIRRKGRAPHFVLVVVVVVVWVLFLFLFLIFETRARLAQTTSASSTLLQRRPHVLAPFPSL